MQSMQQGKGTMNLQLHEVQRTAVGRAQSNPHRITQNQILYPFW